MDPLRVLSPWRIGTRKLPQPPSRKSVVSRLEIKLDLKCCGSFPCNYTVIIENVITSCSHNPYAMVAAASTREPYMNFKRLRVHGLMALCICQLRAQSLLRPRLEARRRSRGSSKAGPRNIVPKLPIYIKCILD